MFVLDQKYLICYSCAVLRGCWFATSGSPRCEWVGYLWHGGTSSTGAEAPVTGRIPWPRGDVGRASSAVAVAIQYRGAFGIPESDWFDYVSH